MKKRVLSIFFILIISMLSLVSCDLVKGKDYVATGSEYFEFIEISFFYIITNIILNQVLASFSLILKLWEVVFKSSSSI